MSKVALALDAQRFYVYVTHLSRRYVRSSLRGSHVKIAKGGNNEEEEEEEKEKDG